MRLLRLASQSETKRWQYRGAILQIKYKPSKHNYEEKIPGYAKPASRQLIIKHGNKSIRHAALQRPACCAAQSPSATRTSGLVEASNSSRSWPPRASYGCSGQF
jgi:hypothetical protein